MAKALGFASNWSESKVPRFDSGPNLRFLFYYLSLISFKPYFKTHIQHFSVYFKSQKSMVGIYFFAVEHMHKD